MQQFFHPHCLGRKQMVNSFRQEASTSLSHLKGAGQGAAARGEVMSVHQHRPQNKRPCDLLSVKGGE